MARFLNGFSYIDSGKREVHSSKLITTYGNQTIDDTKKFSYRLLFENNATGIVNNSTVSVTNISVPWQQGVPIENLGNSSNLIQRALITGANNRILEHSGDPYFSNSIFSDDSYIAGSNIITSGIQHKITHNNFAAFGAYLTSFNHEGGMAIGRHNSPKNTAIFQIGNGQIYQPKNAYSFNTDGVDYDLGGYSGTVTNSALNKLSAFFNDDYDTGNNIIITNNMLTFYQSSSSNPSTASISDGGIWIGSNAPYNGTYCTKQRNITADEDIVTTWNYQASPSRYSTNAPIIGYNNNINPRCGFIKRFTYNGANFSSVTINIPLDLSSSGDIEYTMALEEKIPKLYLHKYRVRIDSGDTTTGNYKISKAICFISTSSTPYNWGESKISSIANSLSKMNSTYGNEFGWIEESSFYFINNNIAKKAECSASFWLTIQNNTPQPRVNEGYSLYLDDNSQDEVYQYNGSSFTRGWSPVANFKYVDNVARPTSGVYVSNSYNHWAYFDHSVTDLSLESLPDIVWVTDYSVNKSA